MTLQQVSLIKNGWSLFRDQHLYGICSPGRLLYIETPEESGFLEPRESLIRLFLLEEHAQWYRDMVVEYMGIQSLAPVAVNMDDLFSSAPQISAQIQGRHQSTLRVDFCFSSGPHEFFRSIDTLWSAHELKH